MTCNECRIAREAPHLQIYYMLDK